MVALLSLRAGRCERLLHSPPGCLPHTLVWDLGRGYLAAMCAQRGPAQPPQEPWGGGPAGGGEAGRGGAPEVSERPVFVLWDVEAGELGGPF